VRHAAPGGGTADGALHPDRARARERGMKGSLLALVLGSTPLKVGDRAPDFTLEDTEGHAVTLSAMLQHGPVILAFYVKSFTPG